MKLTKTQIKLIKRSRRGTFVVQVSSRETEYSRKSPCGIRELKAAFGLVDIGIAKEIERFSYIDHGIKCRDHCIDITFELQSE